MNLQQALQVAEFLTMCNKRALVEPAFKYRNYTGPAIVSNCTQLDIGFACGKCGLALEELPKRSRTGVSFHNATVFF